MPYRVTARINVETGEFEIFQIDDLAPQGSGASHDEAHEEAATRIGGLIERRPGIEEVTPGVLDPGSVVIPPWSAERQQTEQAPADRETLEDG